MLTLTKPYSLATNLSCSNCKKVYSLTELNGYAACCNKPLLVNFDLPFDPSKNLLNPGLDTIWRYAAMLPVFNRNNIVSLGEGMTPLIHLQKLF